MLCKQHQSYLHCDWPPCSLGQAVLVLTWWTACPSVRLVKQWHRLKRGQWAIGFPLHHSTALLYKASVKWMDTSLHNTEHALFSVSQTTSVRDMHQIYFFQFGWKLSAVREQGPGRFHVLCTATIEHAGSGCEVTAVIQGIMGATNEVDSFYLSATAVPQRRNSWQHAFGDQAWTLNFAWCHYFYSVIVYSAPSF